MKKLCILSLLLSVYLPLSSQNYTDVNGFNNGKQTHLEYQANPFDNALEIFEPGPLPEGDLIRVLTYSPDGSILAAMYQHSDNIFFYNTTTYALLAIVDVGREPMDMTMSDQSAYVCCHTSNELYVIDLSDFSISNTFDVYEKPCQVEFNQDETIVYVGCESSSDGSVAAYNLRSGEEIFHTFEPKIALIGHFPSLGRTAYFYTEFSLSPHSNYIIATNSEDDAPAIFNGSTGELVKKFSFGEMRNSGFSETGDTLYILSAFSYDSISLHRVRLNDFSVIDSIVAGTEYFSLYSAGLAINADGTKALTSVDYFLGREYCLFDFNLHNCQSIPEAGMIFWNTEVYTSSDKRHAIVRGWGLARFIDLETGQVINRTPVYYPVGKAVAISPIDDKMACGDGPYYEKNSYSEENFYIFDIANPANIPVDTVIMSGLAPEADITNCAVLSIDGSKIIASNMLSDNISIIDYASGQLDTLIYLEGVSVVKTIPNTDYILVAGEDAIKTWLIDLRNNSIISELTTGNVKDAFVTADGEYAYTFAANSTTTGSLIKISLDGESSEIVNFLTLGFKSCSYFDNKLRSKIALSPDEKYVLSVADDESLGAVVLIVNTQLMEVVKTIPIDDGCVFDFAFTDDSKRVCVLNQKQLPIIYLDGENSFIESEVNIYYYKCLTADYNPVDGLFYVLAKTDWLYQVNPENGEILGQIPTSPDNYVQVMICQDGSPLIRGFEHLLFNDVSYALPGASQDFSFNDAFNLYVIPIPGPDKICVFNPLLTEVSTFPESANEEGITIFPNPADKEVFIYSESVIENIRMYNTAGKLVFSTNWNELSASISIDRFTEGTYLIVTQNADGLTTRKLIVIH